LGIEIAKGLTCCDAKMASQEFVRAHWSENIEHMFTNVDGHIAGVGKCAIHANRVCTVPITPADVFCLGPPCQPWTEQRARTNISAKTATPELHPSYTTTMHKAPQLLAERHPLGAILEEVVSILKPGPGGISACDQLVEELSKLFAGVEVVRLDASSWAKVARERRSAP
jgi:site-specific DNA-cytosine methylase